MLADYLDGIFSNLLYVFRERLKMSSAKHEVPETECPVCHEDFKEPKILFCGHHLCCECLVTWLKSNTEGRCPLCRNDVVSTKDRASKKTVHELVDALPTDLLMMALTESVRALKHESQCSMCFSASATSLCYQCNALLCQSCVKLHGNLMVCRSHKVEALTSLKPEVLAATRPLPCSAHADRMSELYCGVHEAPICMLCAVSDHRDCNNMKKLDEKLTEARQSLSELDARLVVVESLLTEVVSKLQKHLTKSEANLKSGLKEIDTACDRIQKSLEACRKRLKDQVLNADKQITATGQEVKCILDQRRGSVTSHRLLIKRMQETAPPNAVFSMLTSLKTRVDDVVVEAMKATENKINAAHVAIDTSVFTSLQKAISELGDLKLVAVPLGTEVSIAFA